MRARSNRCADRPGRPPGGGAETREAPRREAALDPDALATRGLSAADVVRALREQNVQVAAGQLGQEPVAGQVDFQVPITTLGRLPDAAAFA